MTSNDLATPPLITVRPVNPQPMVDFLNALADSINDLATGDVSQHTRQGPIPHLTVADLTGDEQEEAVFSHCDDAAADRRMEQRNEAQEMLAEMRQGDDGPLPVPGLPPMDRETAAMAEANDGEEVRDE